MLAYLRRTQGVRLSNLNDLAKTIGLMLDSDYLSPRQQAALFEFLATTPRITVVLNVSDVAGRAGIGVGWSVDGGRAMLIFAPISHRYLGTSTQGLRGQVSGEALLQSGIVDMAGQVPAAAPASRAL